MDDYKESEANNANGDNNNNNEEAENLWNTFLKTAVSSGRGLQKSGHLVIFGDNNCGKTSLVSQFQKLELRTGDMKKFLMMRYSYLHLTSTDSDESRALLNIWQISEPAHAEVLDVVIPKEHMPHVSYMICLDLTLPSMVEQTFLKWMEVITQTHERLIKRLTQEEQESAKVKLFKLVQFYVNPKDDDAEPFTEEERAEMELQQTNPEVNLGCPIIIVATKCDAFRKLFKAEAAAEDRFDILCAYIRMWALKYGATAFSMAKSEKEQARRILSYVDHRIFDSEFSRAPNAVVKLSNLAEKFLFIPSGFDSMETITAQNPNRSMSDPFQNIFKPSQKAKHTSSNTRPPKKAETNEHFLKTIKFTLDNAGPRPHGRTAASSKPRGNNSRRKPKKPGDAVDNFFQHLLQNANNNNNNNNTNN